MGKRKIFRDKFLNDSVFIHYYNELKQLALSAYKWKNLPPEIDARFLELMLYEKGTCVFFYDDVVQRYVVQPYTWWGSLNIYLNPRRIRTYSLTTPYRVKLRGNDKVLIWNNYIREPSVEPIRFFAKRLYNIATTIDINVHAQKTPILLTVESENDRLTLENVYEKYTGNSPVIMVDKNLNLNGKINALTTTAPFIAPQLNVLKHDIMNEALTFLGIRNGNQDKKERLVSDEATLSDSATIAHRNTMLDMRKQAAENINRVFGLDIDVVPNDEIRGVSLTDIALLGRYSGASEFDLSDEGGD